MLQTTTDIKNKKNTTITLDYLQESIGKAASDLETVDYNNDTTVADLFEPKLETIEEGDENKNVFEDVKFVKTVYNINNNENKRNGKRNLEQKKQKRFNLLKKCMLICVYD